MDHDEMLRLWRGQAELDGPSPEEIVMEIKKRSRKFDRSLLWRDACEVVAGLLGAGLMLGVSLQIPGWWPKLGALAAGAIMVYVLTRLLGARRKAPKVSPSMPLAERLRAEVAKVEAQIELLSSVGSWYVWPLAVAGTLWGVSIVPALDVPPALAVALFAFVIAVGAIIFSVVGFVVVKLNRRVVAKHLEPYRRDLQEHLGQLE